MSPASLAIFQEIWTNFDMMLDRETKLDSQFFSWLDANVHSYSPFFSFTAGKRNGKFPSGYAKTFGW